MSTPPLSWLLLERYHLGETAPDERHQIERHLEACPASRDRLQQIRHDHRPLPALPPTPAPATGRRRLRWSTLPLLSAAVAVAAAVLLWVPSRPPPPARILTRGGEIALSLTREREGQIQPDPEAFAEGDRFSARLTCPPGEATAWTLTAFQGDQSTPLATGSALSCGNQVPLPGAFRLDGRQAVLICATLSAQPPSYPRQATVCQRLQPTLGDDL